MNDTMIVYGVVLGAALYVGLKYLPAGLKARFGLGGGGKSCASGSCATKPDGGCDGCH